MWIVSEQYPDGRRPLVVYQFDELRKAEEFLDMIDPGATGLFQIELDSSLSRICFPIISQFSTLQPPTRAKENGMIAFRKPTGQQKDLPDRLLERLLLLILWVSVLVTVLGGWYLLWFVAASAVRRAFLL